MSSLNFPDIDGSTTFPTNLPPYFGSVLFETFLYGLYAILFAICAYVLLSRNKKLHWILFVSATVMFALATGDIIYTYYILFGKLLKGGLTFDDMRPKYWLYVTNNVLADSLLLYRCWVVWEYRKLIIVGPVILLAAGTGCGYVLEGAVSSLFDKAWIYLVMTLVLNLILTALTAGRIWWLARKAKLILGSGLLRRYSATITILIESGIIYSFYIILVLGLRKHAVAHASRLPCTASTHLTPDPQVILDGGLIQVVGIMPTLIIVQVGLGRAVHDIEATDALARLEGHKSKSAAPRGACACAADADADGSGSGMDIGIHCVRSRSCPHASSETVVTARHLHHARRHSQGATAGHGGGGASADGGGALDADLVPEIGIESLRQLRGASLQLSWEFGISASSPQELGVLHEPCAVKTV